MSVYDFNHNEHIISNFSNSNSNNNNNSIACNDGGPIAPSNGLRMATTTSMTTTMMMTRPAELVTSKTAMYVRQRRSMLEQLSCHICQGYLIDATTIDECMDSFCKSCIIKYLRSHSNCPKCGCLIHETNPLGAIRPDKVLQDIVYKLVPGLYDDEMKRRREFYRGLVGSSSSEDDNDESSGSSDGSGGRNGISAIYNSEKYGVISYPKQFYKPTDTIELSIEPHSKGDSPTIYYDNKRNSVVTCFTGNISHQQLVASHGSLFSQVDSQKFKTYLKCPAKLTALQLKRFIAAKFNICRDDTIHLLYLNESLKDAYSLIDLAYIYDWRGTDHMRLLYKIERNLASPKQLQDSTTQSTRHTTVMRQSVATSTQTVKRVCIDPNPKYYEVQTNSSSAQRTYGRNTATPSTPSRSIRNVTTTSCQSTATSAAIPDANRQTRNDAPSTQHHHQYQQHQNQQQYQEQPQHQYQQHHHYQQEQQQQQYPKQLTFSFVTERGITIVRRNNPDGTPSTASSSSPYQALPAPESCSTSTTHSQIQSGQPTTSGVASKQQNLNAGGSSPRNHLKAVKPVYKVLVDPSKIKSPPNFKKISTARH